MDELVSELRASMITTEVGQMVHHPLVVMFYSENMAGVMNKQLQSKRAAIHDLVMTKRYEQIVWIFERPYRLNALEQYGSLIKEDAEYWALLKSVWTDSENIFENDAVWRKLLAADRPGREAMMDESELANFNLLNEFVNVYRGTTAEEDTPGLSWTLRQEQARWFANRFRSNGKVISQRIHKSHIVALNNSRGESEVIVL